MNSLKSAVPVFDFRMPVVVVAALTLLSHDPAHAATAGHVTHLSGILSVKRDDGPTKMLSVKSEIQEGDLLTTESETYARIKFIDGGEVVMRPGTQLKVESYVFADSKPQSDSVVLNMLKGGLRAVTGLIGKRNRDAVSFKTTTATIGIRGTHHGQLSCNNDCNNIPTVSGKPPENGLHVDVAAGAIVLTNAAGRQEVGTGQFGFVRSANTLPVIVPPQQGIQVTMPANISRNSGAGRSVGKGKESECVAQ